MTELYVPKEKHSKICLMAPGPTLNQEQADLIKASGLFTIVIGDAYRLYPDAHLMYHSDKRWWDHYDGVPQFTGGQRVSMEDAERKSIKQVLKSDQREGVDMTPSTVVGGSSSGYQSIGIALHHGAKEIVLVGYNYKRSNGVYNVIGKHPKGIAMTSETQFETMLLRMGSLIKPLEAMGVSVYNCTIDTGLTCFPVRSLKDVI